jgi:hypothetical protein
MNRKLAAGVVDPLEEETDEPPVLDGVVAVVEPPPPPAHAHKMRNDPT